MFRRAARAEGGALWRLLLATEHQAADAVTRLLLLRHDGPEPRLGIEGSIRFGEAEAALRDFADAAPAPLHDAEHLAHDSLRWLVAEPSHRSAVLVLYLRAALLELSD